MKRCPACESSRYYGAPAGYLRTKIKGLFSRCEVCKGAGVADAMTIMGWELSL